MTIGEKIKYFRSRIGITQAKLAELSGIHPVSIRKYETNKKMQKQGSGSFSSDIQIGRVSEKKQLSEALTQKETQKNGLEIS